MTANNFQVGGTHYKEMALEHWDVVALDNLDYFQGCITKYVMRWRGKNGIQDLEKAKHYLDKYIEIEALRKDGKLTIGILMAAIKKLEELDRKMQQEEQKDHASSLSTDGDRVVSLSVELPRRACPQCLNVLPTHAIGCSLAIGRGAACELCGGLENHRPTCPQQR